MSANVRNAATAEYSAVRDGGAGLLDLSGRGRILVAGSEAVMFLNGLITNDIKNLALNSWMAAAFLNVQGRLLAVVRILNGEHGFVIDTETVTHEKVMKLLDRFTVAGDFRVTDVTSEIVAFSLQGRRAAEIIRDKFGEAAASLARGTITSVPADNLTARLIRATQTGEDGFDLFVEATDSDLLRRGLTDAGAAPVGEATAETLRIEAGIPRYGVDMDEATIVTETNLDDAVSFTKGCYIGQEIVIRIKHRGHVAKKLTGIVLDEKTDVETGGKIMSADDKEIGRVTSTTFSPALDRTIALGYVKYDYLAPGTMVKVSSSKGSISAKVSALPLVNGSWLT